MCLVYLSSCVTGGFKLLYYRYTHTPIFVCNRNIQLQLNNRQLKGFIEKETSYFLSNSIWRDTQTLVWHVSQNLWCWRGRASSSTSSSSPPFHYIRETLTLIRTLLWVSEWAICGLYAGQVLWSRLSSVAAAPRPVQALLSPVGLLSGREGHRTPLHTLSLLMISRGLRRRPGEVPGGLSPGLPSGIRRGLPMKPLVITLLDVFFFLYISWNIQELD